jgi:hypothetical protein
MSDCGHPMYLGFEEPACRCEHGARVKHNFVPIRRWWRKRAICIHCGSVKRWDWP